MLHGEVTPNGEATTFQFEYGTTTSYGDRAPASAANAGSGAEAIEVDEFVNHLQPATTYYFRVVARNASGTVYGAAQTLHNRVGLRSSRRANTRPSSTVGHRPG